MIMISQLIVCEIYGEKEILNFLLSFPFFWWYFGIQFMRVFFMGCIVNNDNSLRR